MHFLQKNLRMLTDLGHLVHELYLEHADLKLNEVKRARRLVLILACLPDLCLLLDEGGLGVLVEAECLNADAKLERVHLEILRGDEERRDGCQLQISRGEGCGLSSVESVHEVDGLEEDLAILDP